jgi:hypothetical protein
MNTDLNETPKPEPLTDLFLGEPMIDMLWEDSDLYALLGVEREATIAHPYDDRLAA